MVALTGQSATGRPNPATNCDSTRYKTHRAPLAAAHLWSQFVHLVPRRDDQTQKYGNNAPVATSSETTSTLPAKPHGALHPIANPRRRGIPGRPDAVPVGIIVFLASELMFFATLFAAYFTIMNVTNAMAGPGEQTLWQSGQALLTPGFALGNTLILVLSSVTCQLGVHAAENGQVKRTGGPFNILKWGLREWYILTFVMGSTFIGGQVFEYAELIHKGMTISTDVYGSVFFLATGFHGLHVIAGLIIFLFVLGRTYVTRTFTHEQATSAIAASYYWHFVDIVWIVLFAVIYAGPLYTMFTGG